MSKVVKWILCALMLCVLLSASLSAERKFKFGKISDEEMNQGAPPEYPEANVVVLFSYGYIDVTKDIITIDYHYRAKILTPAGVDEVDEQIVFYNKELDKLKKFKAHTISPRGKKHKVEKDAIFEKQNGNLIEKTFAFPQLEQGAIIEFTYQIKSKNYWYLKPWYFQSDFYTFYSEVNVCLGVGFAYDETCFNIKPQFREPEISEKLDSKFTGPGSRRLKVFKWKLENLPPVYGDEPYMSSVKDYLSSIQFQLVSFTYTSGQRQYFVSTWQEEGKEIEQDIINQYRNKDGDLKKIADSVTAGLTSPHEKSKALFRYVAKEFSGTDDYSYWYFNNNKRSGFLENRTGSYEEKNVLLSDLMVAAGIQAWPVMISTRDHMKFNPKYPDRRDFNYIITLAQFGNKWEFLDASRNNSLYGILPPDCLTEGGLILDGENSDLVKLAVNPVESYRQDITDIYISPDGAAVCSTNCRFTGYYAAEYARRMDNNSEEDFKKKYFVDRLEGIGEVSFFECRVDSVSDVHITSVFEGGDLIRKLENNLIIEPVTLAFRNNPFESAKRFFPVDFNYPFIYQSITNIHLPDNVTEINLPDSIDMDIGGATYSLHTGQDGSTLVLSHELFVKRPEFKPVKYRSVKDLFQIMSEKATEQLSLVIGE